MGCELHILSRKRANRRAWQLSMNPDGLLSLAHYSAISPHSSSNACTSGSSCHPACPSAFQQKGAVSTPRHMLVALSTFHNPTYQLNFSTRRFEVLQYSWKKKKFYFNILLLPVTRIRKLQSVKIEGCCKKGYSELEKRSPKLAISATFQQENRASMKWFFPWYILSASGNLSFSNFLSQRLHPYNCVWSPSMELSSNLSNFL